MRMRLQGCLAAAIAAVGICTGARTALADGATSHDTTAPAATEESAPAPAQGPNERIDQFEKYKLSFLPPVLREGLYVDVWGWGSYLNISRGDHRADGDGQLSLDITKSFAGRVAFTTELSFLDANGHTRLFTEQLFGSVLLSESSQIVVTAGRFHAGIGAEGRDFWDRSTGTTSLLFSAQPQDFTGLIASIPVASTGVTLKPFLTTNFQGTLSFSQPPSGGLIAQYEPFHGLNFSITNWVGPGFGSKEDDDDDSYDDAWKTPPRASAWDDSDWGGDGASTSGSGAYGGSAGAVENWMGPRLDAQPMGTLYFVDGKVAWTPRNDLTLTGQALLATTPSYDGAAGWQGCMALATYDINDQWEAFGRWSFLDDSAGLVTGTAQRRHELSGGLTYKFLHNMEVRGEYRHDFSDTQGDLDTLSVHLMFHF